MCARDTHTHILLPFSMSLLGNSGLKYVEVTSAVAVFKKYILFLFFLVCDHNKNILATSMWPAASLAFTVSAAHQLDFNLDFLST